jgi:hypothetical protein
MMNWKGCGRKPSWPNVSSNPDICPEGPRKTTKNLSQDILSPSRDLKLGPSEYEAAVLTTRPRRSTGALTKHINFNVVYRPMKPEQIEGRR